LSYQGGGRGHLLIVVIRDECLYLHSGWRWNVIHLLVLLIVFVVDLVLDVGRSFAGREIRVLQIIRRASCSQERKARQKSSHRYASS
jgi:hypothetical protein